MIRLLEAAADFCACALFLALFGIVLAGVAWRYGLDAPLFWADEAAMIAFVWCTFVTDALVTRERDHVAFDILWDVSGPAARRATGIAQCVIFGVLFALALPPVVDYVLFLRLERTAALEWRLDWVFACFVLYLASVVVRLGVKFWRLCSADWRRWVARDDAPSTSNVIG